MYESPIDVFIEDIQMQFAEGVDEQVYQAVVNVGVNVDKGELLRALAYDREQYTKGLEDGKPRWIPVAERLPEVEDEYLVVVKYKYDHEKEYSVDTDVAMYSPNQGGYIDNCWNTYNDWDEGQHYIHITHWMPLPEPPKEDSDNA